MTKQELSKLLDEKLGGVATKKDLSKIETKLSGLESQTASKDDSAKLEALVATKKDLGALQSGIGQVLADGILPQLDKLATRMVDLRDAVGRIERQLYAVVDRQDRQDEVQETHVKTLADHEQRLGILEPSAS